MPDRVLEIRVFCYHDLDVTVKKVNNFLASDPEAWTVLSATCGRTHAGQSHWFMVVLGRV